MLAQCVTLRSIRRCRRVEQSELHDPRMTPAPALHVIKMQTCRKWWRGASPLEGYDSTLYDGHPRVLHPSSTQSSEPSARQRSTPYRRDVCWPSV